MMTTINTKKVKLAEFKEKYKKQKKREFKTK